MFYICAANNRCAVYTLTLTNLNFYRFWWCPDCLNPRRQMIWLQISYRHLSVRWNVPLTALLKSRMILVLSFLNDAKPFSASSPRPIVVKQPLETAVFVIHHGSVVDSVLSVLQVGAMVNSVIGDFTHLQVLSLSWRFQVNTFT